MHRGHRPVPRFPVPIEGQADDVSDIIEQYREHVPFSDQVTVMTRRSTPNTARC